MRVTFYGGIDQVTGSCTHLHYTPKDVQFLVDCGMVQGTPHADFENAKAFPFDPSALKFVLLTHAHLDHCGLIPRLYREGFTGTVYCTRATARIATEVLLDSARITNNEFYGEADVERIKFHHLDRRKEFKWGKQFTLDDDLSVYLLRSAHILGACAMGVVWREEHPENGKYLKSMLFSGDIGPTTDNFSTSYLLKESQGPFATTNYLVLESTKGDAGAAETPSREQRLDQLRKLVEEEVLIGRRNLLIPAFSVHRMQEVLYDLITLSTDVFRNRPLSEIPVFPTKDKALDKLTKGISLNYFLELIKSPSLNKTDLRGLLRGIHLAPNLSFRSPPNELDEQLFQDEVDVEKVTQLLTECKGAIIKARPGAENNVAGLLQKIMESKHIPVRCESAMGNKIGEIYCEELFTERAPGKNLYFPEAEPEERVSAFRGALMGKTELGVFSFSCGSKSTDFGRIKKSPSIIISSGGMCDGGFILTHLANALKEAQFTVVLTGYQSAGTNGAKLKKFIDDPGFEDTLVLGEIRLPTKEIKAKVLSMDGYSGHASPAIIMGYHLARLSNEAMHGVFLNHGSHKARIAFKEVLGVCENETVRSLNTIIPGKGETYQLKNSNVELVQQTASVSEPSIADLAEVLRQINQDLREIKVMLKTMQSTQACNQNGKRRKK